MRLIDADALCARIENEFDGVCVYDVSGNEAAREFCNMVDVAPTIAAIPVEWLKQWRDKLKGMGEYQRERAEDISFVLGLWQKEQEAR